MKKNRMAFPVVLMVLAGLVFAAVFSCDTSKVRGATQETYTGADNDGKEYKLVITDKYYYELFIEGKSISTGWVIDIDGDTYQLRQSSTKDDFLVTLEGKNITKIVPERERIVLTPDDGSEPIAMPGELLPPSKPGEGNNPVEGKWIWYASGDSTPNNYLDVQTVFAPGGASKLSNWELKVGEDGKPIKDSHGADTYAPYEYPADKKPKDKDGNAITGPVFNLKGNTKVHKEGRSANEGARFPLVGWGAIPDDDATKAALKTAYGYSFWVKLNSSTASKWSFLTAVQTDFPPEKGYEYKHWFGNVAGDSGGSKIENYTLDLKVGTWYKITVIMDVKDKGFNMDEDGWLYQWPPKPDPKKPFNQAAASEIQWQIPLQHQEGAGVKARSGDPYDITNGSYDFDVDFYGLELLSK